MFKVGDFVREVGGRILVVTQDLLHIVNAENKRIFVSKWQPKEGEWCFVDDSLCICTRVTKENTFIVENSTRGTIEVTLNAVEPFIGTLPSFTKKDKQ